MGSRITLAAGAVVLALLALPSMAHGDESLCGPEVEGEGTVTWTHEGEPLEEPECIQLTGILDVEVDGFQPYGFEGVAEIELLLQPGGVASVASFSWPGCEGTEFFLGLSCTALSPSNWNVTVGKSGTFTIHDLEMENIFYAGNDTGHTTPIATTVLEIDATTHTVDGAFDNFEAFSELQFGGEGHMYLGSEPTDATIEGQFEVTPPGTYGILE